MRQELVLAEREDPAADFPVTPRRNRRADATILVTLVLGIFIAFILAGAILPTAFSQIFNASTAGWTSATVTVFQLLPLLGVVALILTIVAVARGRLGALKGR